MRRTIVLLLAVLACACGPAAPAQSPGDGDEAAAPVAIDAAWLELVNLPDLRGKPLVLVQNKAVFLVEEDDADITVFDGLESVTIRWGETPRFKPLDDLTAHRLLTAGSGLLSTLKAVVIASMLERGSRRNLASSVLRRRAGGTAQLRSLVQEGVSRVAAREAIRRHADGGSLVEFERALRRIALLSGTRGAKVAGDLLAALSGPRPPEPVMKTPLDVLVWARVRALAEERCTAAVGPRGPGDAPRRNLRGLGLSAVAALEQIKDDTYPSRCTNAFEGDDETASICDVSPDACGSAEDIDIPNLVTVGQLAKGELSRLASPRTQIDLSDVECDRTRDYADTMVLGFVEAALAAGELAAASTIVKSARGLLRVRLVDLISARGGAASRPFLEEEARSGPVLQARMRAVNILAIMGDTSAVASLAPLIDGAIRAVDGGGMRCDHWSFTGDGFNLLLNFAPTDALELLRQSFPGYGPRAQLLVVFRLLTLIPAATASAAAIAKTRDAILLLALSALRPIAGASLQGARSRLDGSSGQGCTDSSPSDVAATALGERLGVRYSCAGSAEEKAAAVRAIRDRMTAKR